MVEINEEVVDMDVTNVEHVAVDEETLETGMLIGNDDFAGTSTPINDDIDVDIYDIDPEMVPTPGGSKYWVPNVLVADKPDIKDVYDTFEEGYKKYKDYAAKARFGVRKSGVKHYKGEITHKYLLCNKAGKPKTKAEVNTLIQNENEINTEGGKKKRKRKSSSSLTDCQARLVLKPIIGTQKHKVNKFIENHNHPLMNKSNMDLSRARRQLEFGDYMFIHRASLTNIGPQKAHRLKVALLGGFDKVRGMPVDWNNFKRKMNVFIRDRDAQMLVDKMVKRMEHVPEFSFVHHTKENNVLCRMFWADETMKCNYVAFGEIVSFDATFETNKYDMIFVPFTGIDHHQKCVTFGAALLSDEKKESYKWMLESFLKVHGKQPILAVTDQDGALRNAIVEVFTESHHRLCMWHITQKLPAKVLGDVGEDSDFRKDFHKLVWNVYISPQMFDDRWNAMILKYQLSENKWLNDMFAIRDRWVPGYFSHVPFCGLMKTTSRSESSNAFFQVYSSHGNSLVHFMLCFESAMEKQRYTQRVLDNKTAEKTPVMVTDLPIEKHACSVYTESIFRDVQDEIYKGLYACSQRSVRMEDNVEYCEIQQKDKQKNIVVDVTVTVNHLESTISCSCGHFNRHGFLCRHVFCVFNIRGIDTIPLNYVSRRWRKNPLPAHLNDKRHRYGPCIEESEVLSSEVYSIIESCINLIRNESDKMAVFIGKLKELKTELEADCQPQAEPQNKDALFEDLLGVTVPVNVNILNPPEVCATKGHTRIKSAAELAKEALKANLNRKVPFKQRTCSNCLEIEGHNVRGCKKPCGNCGKKGHKRLGCRNPPLNKKSKKVVEEEENQSEEEDFIEKEVDSEEEDFIEKEVDSEEAIESEEYDEDF